MANNPRSQSKHPPKGILKQTPGFKTPSGPSEDSSTTSREAKKLAAASKKAAHYDEENIIATLHPAEKDYGHMKIDEPDTPWNFHSGSEEDLANRAVNSDELAKRIREIPETRSIAKSTISISSLSSDDEEGLTEEEKRRRRAFREKRKSHYREYQAVLDRKKRGKSLNDK